jgi:hypothetical protein
MKHWAHSVIVCRIVRTSSAQSCYKCADCPNSAFDLPWHGLAVDLREMAHLILSAAGRTAFGLQRAGTRKLCLTKDRIQSAVTYA